LWRGPRVVVDATVLVDALSSIGDRGARVREAVGGARLVGPEHLRVETFHGIRGLVLGRKLDVVAARRATDRLERTSITTVRATALLERMWELHPNVSGYGAAYVAAAERLCVPLLTSDQRLAAARGPRCAITVV
jgi:predicted nucleic acid-binding protein